MTRVNDSLSERNDSSTSRKAYSSCRNRSSGRLGGASLRCPFCWKQEAFTSLDEPLGARNGTMTRRDEPFISDDASLTSLDASFLRFSGSFIEVNESFIRLIASSRRDDEALRGTTHIAKPTRRHAGSTPTRPRSRRGRGPPRSRTPR